MPAPPGTPVRPPAAPGALRNAAPLPAPPDPVTRSPPPGRPPWRRGASGRRGGSRFPRGREGEPGPPGERDPRRARTAQSRARRRSCRAARGRRCFPGRGRARGALAGPRELRLPAHPVLGRKVIRPPPASLSLRFSLSCPGCPFCQLCDGLRLAARQRERTSTSRVGKKLGAGSITLPAWLGAAEALPSPRPGSQPLTRSTALQRPPPPARSQRRSSGLPRARRGPKGSQRNEGQAALCLPKALRDPRPPVPHAGASSSAHGALPEIPRRHGPPRRAALQ